MNIKLAEETTRVIVYAKRFADSSGNRMISTEFMLAGICALQGSYTDALERSGITLETLASMLGFDDSVMDDDIEKYEIEDGLRVLRLESKRLLNDASEVSTRIGDNGIVKPEHLLFVIATNKALTGNQVLIRAGADINGLIDEVSGLLSETGELDPSDENLFSTDGARGSLGPGLPRAARTEALRARKQARAAARLWRSSVRTSLPWQPRARSTP